jgi:hypothetical protein
VTNVKVKRGVSLYSFQEEYFLRKLDLEGCIAKAADMGALGIELLPEQMMPGFPNLTDHQVGHWHELMAEYGTTPSAYDMFLDTKRVKGRLLTLDEQVESVVRDLKLANRLGFKVMRVLVFVSPELMERCLPYAEQYDVKMGIEVHSPYSMDHPWMGRFMEIIERTGTKHLGFVPDMGMICERFPPVFRDRYIREGARPEIADFIVQQYEERILCEYTIYEVAVKMRGNKAEIAMAENLRHTIYTDPRRLAAFAPYIFHIHAKFYEMAPDYHETSIPYEKIVPVLIDAGVDCYLSSEYEGNRHIQDIEDVDSIEQVRRQQVMFSRLLGETQKEAA